MILRVQVFRAVMVLAAGFVAAAVIPGSAAVATVAPRTAAVSAAVSRPGALTGVVIDRQRQPVAGVCVTATGATPTPDAGGRTTVTSADGMFTIAGLPAGLYLLHYRNCLVRPGDTGSSRAAALGSGPLAAPAVAARGYVTGGHVTMVGRIILRPRAAGPAAEMPTRPVVRRITAAQLRRRSGQQHSGGIAGRVLGRRGRPIKGLCYFINAGGFTLGGPIKADGRYSTGKELPPGKYTVDFSADCDLATRIPASDWATEWYRGHLSPPAADPVVIKAGEITQGIDGTMVRGGVITGTVTGQGGRALARVCVVAETARGAFVQQITTPRDGKYRFQALDPGQYRIGFFPDCARGGNGYLPQWWPGTVRPTKRGLIKTGIGTVRTHIDAKLDLGGTISGTVRFKNRHGRPLKGICVDATPAGRPDADDFFVATDPEGRYSISGMPAGRYALNFGPGCNNNGNFLSQKYPHSVTVRLSQVTGGINAYLQPGAIITGTVTAKSDGAKLSGICVSADDGFEIGRTRADGTYLVNQLSPGAVQIQFFNCGNDGNFAPQFYPGQLNGAEATSIKVRAGQVVKGIDAAMTPGATISGAITLPSGAKPSNVCVFADTLSFADDLGGSGAMSRHGRYVIQNLPPDTYQVEFDSCGGPNIADSFFGQPGQATGDESRADQINLPAGGTVANISAALRFGGSIGGWIYGPPKQKGSFVCLTVSDARTGAIQSNEFAVPQGDGYQVFGFAPGRYLVEFVPCGGESLADQWYNRASQPAEATPVLVRPRQITQKINAHLTAGGSITGHVTSKTTGKPLAGVCVTAEGPGNGSFAFGSSDQTGKYMVTGLGTATYRLIFTSCAQPRLVPVLARPVRATAGKTVTGPDVAMVPVTPGGISGSVSAAGSARPPVADACIDAFPVGRGALADFEIGFGATGRHGRYVINGLVPGKYDLFVGDEGCATDPVGLVPQWYLGAARKASATPVTVAAGRTTRSVSTTLSRDGSISGTVTGPKPAAKPLAGICVQVRPLARGATPFLAQSTASNGGYQTGPLPPGKYLVEFESGCGAAGYATQWWHRAASMKAATPVTVLAGRTALGVSASMTKAAR